MLDQRLPRPDLVIYLEARPEVLLRRLRKRDRDFERAITPEYLERLTEAFRDYFHRYTEAPLLVVNCSDIDFVEHGGDFADLIKEIRAMRQGVQHYIPLGSRLRLPLRPPARRGGGRHPAGRRLARHGGAGPGHHAAGHTRRDGLPHAHGGARATARPRPG